MPDSPSVHHPVLLRETLSWLAPRSGGRYVDGTLGGAGHAEAILDASSPDGELLGIDWDEPARERAARRLAHFGERVKVYAGSYADLGELLESAGWDAVDGILLDLGVSSFQLDEADRGFSFSRSGPLDMRMDRDRGPSVAEWLHGVEQSELARVLREFGEEPRAGRIARAMIDADRRGELGDTVALATLVARVVGRSPGHHPATRSFQALRIAVNGELAELDRFLADAWKWLRPGGRLVMLAYHSLEDRRVKQAFALWNRECLCPRDVPVCRCGWSRKVRLLTPRPVRPTDAEVEANPRARSARLRAVERVAA
ncbi:MAG: 16S rRNA (cytosine(1402)-N(4))-methyltransferase RsmH [Candidatus Binatia bacterium]